MRVKRRDIVNKMWRVRDKDNVYSQGSSRGSNVGAGFSENVQLAWRTVGGMFVLGGSQESVQLAGPRPPGGGVAARLEFQPRKGCLSIHCHQRG